MDINSKWVELGVLKMLQAFIPKAIHTRYHTDRLSKFIDDVAMPFRL
ncbi:hypothetical protein V3C10_04395 [[Clostridium] symbiosum]|nr:hypothetical protein [[Clostridium] symbiosum]MCB6610176.1 hypothetical protein [[Clostridium] symbiosum]MCB6933512.1 hypothetical protein [[Clostridium] symbiosum]